MHVYKTVKFLFDTTITTVTKQGRLGRTSNNGSRVDYFRFNKDIGKDRMEFG